MPILLPMMMSISQICPAFHSLLVLSLAFSRVTWCGLECLSGESHTAVGLVVVKDHYLCNRGGVQCDVRGDYHDVLIV